MSGKVVGWAMDQVTGSPVTKLVLLKLADNANENGTCWPSLELMCEHTELSPRSVREHLKRLEQELGLVVVERREQGGVKLPNIYHLRVPKRAKGVVQEVPEGGSAGDAPLVQVAAKGSALPARGSAAPATLYKEEPSKEPSEEPAQERARDANADWSERIYPAWQRVPNRSEANTSESVCRAVWERMRETLPSADELVACIDAYAARLADETRKRGRAGPAFAKSWSNWLERERLWEPLLAELRGKQARLNVEVQEDLKLEARLGKRNFAALIHTGMNYASIREWFGDAVFSFPETGTVRITVPKEFKRSYIASNYARRIGMFFKAEVEVVVAEPKDKAA